MKKRTYTVEQLWAFVNRAETIDEIKTAISYLEKNYPNDGDLFLYDDLMNVLAYKCREYYWNAQGPRKTYAV